MTAENMVPLDCPEESWNTTSALSWVTLTKYTGRHIEK